MAHEIKSFSGRQIHRHDVNVSDSNSTGKSNAPKVSDSNNTASTREVETKRNEKSIETNYWRGRLNSTLSQNRSETGGSEKIFLAQAQPTAPASTMPSVNQSVDRVIVESGRSGGNTGAVLATELNRGDSSFRAQVMGELARRSPQAMAKALSAAGGNPDSPQLTTVQKQSITQALSTAFSSRTLPNDFSAKLISAAQDLDSYNMSPDFFRAIATTISNTGSTGLATAYARSVIDFVNNPPHPLDPGAAVPATQEMLLSSAGVAVQNNPRAIENTLSYLRHNSLLDESAGHSSIARFVTAMASVPNQNGNSVLGDFLAGASGAKLSDVKQLFEIVSNNQINSGYAWLGTGYIKKNLIDAPGVSAGLSRLFLSRSSELLNQYTSFAPNDGKGTDVYNAQTLSNFFRLTTLAESSPYGIRIVDATKKHIDSLRTQIETGMTPAGRHLSAAQREALARQTGRIIGSVIGAYNEAIRDYRNLDASNDLRTKNAVTVASLIATGAAGMAFAPFAAPIYITAGIQGGRMALNHFLTNDTVGEEELKRFENLIQNNFSNYHIDGGNLDISGVTTDQANTIKTEIFDGMNEMIMAWAVGEGILRR